MAWNIVNTDWNMIAACASALGTLAAAWAAFASKSTSQKALQLQNRLYLYESLKACAERANECSRGKDGSDWDFNDAANIVRSMNLAKKSIEHHCHSKNVREAKEFKTFFVSLLNMELFDELNSSDAPGAIFRKKGLDSTGIEVWNSWLEVCGFFEFMFATDEDLAD